MKVVLVLDLGSRWGWVVSVASQPLLTPKKRAPDTHWIEGQVGRVQLQMQKLQEKPFAPFEYQTTVMQSVVTRYTDWAIPAP
jgi:hypothetical protein